MHLAQDGKVGLMSRQSKHDEICIQAVEAVLGVGVPAWSIALLPDVPHYLMLPLTRGVCI